MIIDKLIKPSMLKKGDKVATVIRSNPKVFMGYSDTTVNHFMCLKAGLSSLYGLLLVQSGLQKGLNGICLKTI